MFDAIYNLVANRYQSIKENEEDDSSLEWFFDLMNKIFELSEIRKNITYQYINIRFLEDSIKELEMTKKGFYCKL